MFLHRLSPDSNGPLLEKSLVVVKGKGELTCLRHPMTMSEEPSTWSLRCTGKFLNLIPQKLKKKKKFSVKSLEEQKAQTYQSESQNPQGRIQASLFLTSLQDSAVQF